MAPVQPLRPDKDKRVKSILGKFFRILLSVAGMWLIVDNSVRRRLRSSIAGSCILKNSREPGSRDPETNNFPSQHFHLADARKMRGIRSCRHKDMESLHPTSTRFRFGQTPRHTYYTPSCASLLFPFAGLRKRQWEEYKCVSTKVDEGWNQGCEELFGYVETDSECAPANVVTEKKHLDLALTVLTRVAAYESLFTKSHETILAQDTVSESLVAEYYILRTALVREGSSRLMQP